MDTAFRFALWLHDGSAAPHEREYIHMAHNTPKTATALRAPNAVNAA